MSKFRFSYDARNSYSLEEPVIEDSTQRIEIQDPALDLPLIPPTITSDIQLSLVSAPLWGKEVSAPLFISSVSPSWPSP